jgi:hypothetical protein
MALSVVFISADGTGHGPGALAGRPGRAAGGTPGTRT